MRSRHPNMDKLRQIAFFLDYQGYKPKPFKPITLQVFPGLAIVYCLDGAATTTVAMN